MLRSVAATSSFVGLLVVAGCPLTPPPFEQPAPPPVFVPPPVVCPAPIERVDTAAATRVGDGTVASCTEEAFDNALATHNGAILFNCGGDVVIPITSSKVITSDVVIDGASDVTLDGGDALRILDIASTFDQDTPRVTVQRLTFTRGRTSGNTTEDGGAAIRRSGGTLDVIDCNFVANIGNVDGQDTQGGAIFSLGGGATTITGSSFTGNRCSNGGALGTLGGDLVVVNSDFDDNEATGRDGNPGNGGNGGTIYVDGEGRAVALCGLSIRNSKANAFGGGMFRVAYQFTEPTDIDRVVMDGAVIEDQEPSLGGGFYLQGTVVNMSDTTIMNSSARAAGGAFMGPGSTVSMTNVSFLDNVASSSLGGALFISDTLGGDIVNATFAGNRAPGELAFGGAIVGSGAGISLRNSLILESQAGNGFNPISCTTALEDGSGSIQFPVVRSGGGSDDPDALCAGAITVAEVALDAVEDGPVPTRRPAAGSAAAGLGTNCPDRDARGRLRRNQCTAGAVELDPPEG